MRERLIKRVSEWEKGGSLRNEKKKKEMTELKKRGAAGKWEKKKRRPKTVT